ncbi:hypothetical protein PAMP_024755 [Pampus punctatissimus]
MASLDSNSKNKAEEEDIYQFIYTMNSTYDMEEEEKVLSRESSPAIDVIGGQPGSSSRVKMCQSLSNEGSNTQLDTEMSPEEKRFTSFEQPPPFNFTTVFPYTPPPRVSSAIPGSKASSTEMIDTAKASECHIKQDMENRGDKDSSRYKEYDHDHEDSKRGRDKERQSCSSSHNRKDKESNDMFSAD